MKELVTYVVLFCLVVGGVIYMTNGDGEPDTRPEYQKVFPR